MIFPLLELTTSAAMLFPVPRFRLCFFFFFVFFHAVNSQNLPGKWDLLMENAGICSMHTAVTRFGTVVLLERTNNGPTQLKLPGNKCRFDPNERVLKRDCYAHSALYDPATNRLRPLRIQTDTWCSSGQFLPDGTLLQTGGDFDGFRKIRQFRPCPADQLCDWVELNHTELEFGRWYATNQLLPDGRVIIIGGRAAHSIEFYPSSLPLVQFPFLAEVQDPQMDNLYPYVHLLPNGHLFIFANTRSILYDYASNRILHEYPKLEGGPRSYPSAGSSVMLPITAAYGHTRAEVLVCGGAAYGAFIKNDVDSPTQGTCGRIVATDLKASWQLEMMPSGRIMGDMVMLPTGEVLIINGAQTGSQGFDKASNPCLNPVLYRPDAVLGLRFMTLTPTTVPRMYHSTAVLLPDGRVLVAGSNPHYSYKFNGNFPTELRLEAFSPEYLSPDRANLRPLVLEAPEEVRYGAGFTVVVETAIPVVSVVEVNLASAPFATHSFSQGQRLVKLAVSPAVPMAGGGRLRYTISCTAPPSANVAPPSYYMMFAVNQGVPSVAKWVRVSH
ncbi:WSC domain-containing protein [Nymphaea thermarum]|nr:WSC domain-containing protein [Nymphaea thermarum]